MAHTTATPAGAIEHIDPNLVSLEENVRPSAPLTKEFVASIREHGVLEPVLGYRNENGDVLVRAGQRRTLGAREAGVATIPVYVISAQATVSERIVQQIVENDHREALRDADRAAAFQQLAFEGLSVQAIAKRTSTKQAQVKSGLAVAENPVAIEAIQAHQLTLDQAAVLIEFETEETTRQELIEVATTDPGQFAHAAQRARDARTRNQLKAETEAELSTRGFMILDRDRGYYDTDYTRINELVTSEGERVTVEHITETSGRAAYVRVYSSGEAEVIYYLPDPKAAGFRKATGSGATTGPMTDEQKAERRILVANNKSWASAEVVRREWLTSFLARKSLPKDAPAMIARGLSLHRTDVARAMQNGNTLAHTLLGVEPGSYCEPDRLAALTRTNPAKTQHVAVAVVLGGIEESTSKNTWRYPTDDKAAYLTQLAAWGYNLSEVEQIVIDVAERGTTTDEGSPEDPDAAGEKTAGEVELSD